MLKTLVQRRRFIIASKKLRGIAQLFHARALLWKLHVDSGVGLIQRVYRGHLHRKIAKLLLARSRAVASREVKMYMEIMKLRLKVAEQKRLAVRGKRPAEVSIDGALASLSARRHGMSCEHILETQSQATPRTRLGAPRATPVSISLITEVPESPRSQLWRKLPDASIEGFARKTHGHQQKVAEIDLLAPYQHIGAQSTPILGQFSGAALPANGQRDGCRTPPPTPPLRARGTGYRTPPPAPSFTRGDSEASGTILMAVPTNKAIALERGTASSVIGTAAPKRRSCWP